MDVRNETLNPKAVFSISCSGCGKNVKVRSQTKKTAEKSLIKNRHWKKSKYTNRMKCFSCNDKKMKGNYVNR